MSLPILLLSDVSCWASSFMSSVILLLSDVSCWASVRTACFALWKRRPAFSACSWADADILSLWPFSLSFSLSFVSLSLFVTLMVPSRTVFEHELKNGKETSVEPCHQGPNLCFGSLVGIGAQEHNRQCGTIDGTRPPPFGLERSVGASARESRSSPTRRSRRSRSESRTAGHAATETKV